MSAGKSEVIGYLRAMSPLGAYIHLNPPGTPLVPESLLLDARAECPPDGLPEFLDWAADQIVERDRIAGNFTEGLALSLKGRASILRHVAANQEARDADPS